MFGALRSRTGSEISSWTRIFEPGDLIRCRADFSGLAYSPPLGIVDPFVPGDNIASHKLVGKHAQKNAQVSYASVCIS